VFDEWLEWAMPQLIAGTICAVLYVGWLVFRHTQKKRRGDGDWWK
jgi:hypothetical protein